MADIIRITVADDTYELAWDGTTGTLYEVTDNTRVELTTIHDDDSAGTFLDWLTDRADE